MKITGLLMIGGVLIAAASVPAFIDWRFRVHKERVLSAIFFLVAVGILVVPASQLLIFMPMNNRYIDRQKATAEQKALVGQSYQDVVAALGTPNVVRYEPGATIVSPDKSVQVVGKPYTALEYTMRAYWLRSPNFLVILDVDGKVSNFRYND